MRERRIWSGFGYRISLARGLALRGWWIGWSAWWGVLGEILAFANSGEVVGDEKRMVNYFGRVDWEIFYGVINVRCLQIYTSALQDWWGEMKGD
ncbi:MAG: hypothetical protein ACLQVM_03655 [Terriglobia bacterium]